VPRSRDRGRRDRGRRGWVGRGRVGRGRKRRSRMECHSPGHSGATTDKNPPGQCPAPADTTTPSSTGGARRIRRPPPPGSCAHLFLLPGQSASHRQVSAITKPHRSRSAARRVAQVSAQPPIPHLHRQDPNRGLSVQGGDPTIRPTPSQDRHVTSRKPAIPIRWCRGVCSLRRAPPGSPRAPHW
jgi:hypothetical protein